MRESETAVSVTHMRKPKVRIERDVWEQGDIWIVSGSPHFQTLVAQMPNFELADEIVAALNTARGW
jgi:hypothetical protein